MHEEMHILPHNNLEEMTWEKQKMNYKMIAVDMDGTLLDSRKQISDETVRAVRQLAESGVLFVISIRCFVCNFYRKTCPGSGEVQETSASYRAGDHLQRRHDRECRNRGNAV